MELQKVNEELANTFSDADFLKQLAQVNLLTSYPLQDAYIESWLKSIKELAPEITPKTLKLIIDGMKSGIIKYDHRLGIQNIFLGFKDVLNDYIIDRRELENKTFGDVYDRNTESEEYKLFQKETKRIYAIIARFSPKHKLIR